MKIRTLLAAALMFLMTVGMALAADITGKWTGEVQGQGGQSRPVTFNFKADGATLTGTTTGRGGEVQISEGKIDGDNISFVVVREFQGNQVKINYTGKVEGGEIKMKQSMGERSSEFTLKKTTT